MNSPEGGEKVAEIPIQEKRGRNIWPWIIGAVVLLLALWLLLGRKDDDDTTTPATQDSTKTSLLMTPRHFATVALPATQHMRG